MAAPAGWAAALTPSVSATSFHLDHAAALTYIMEKTNFKDGPGKVYMTHPTKEVYRFLMSDFVRISNAGSDDQLYDEHEMISSWRQIEAVDYHQEVNVTGGIRFTPYHAGHVLGACMFFIEMGGLKILYTGDYSREEDRHLVQGEVPPVKPDVLICESTYGTRSHGPRLEKEQQFTNLIHKVLLRGGRVLLPVFVLGRAQELLLLLDEYWAKHPELQTIPIYYASALAQKCIRVYQRYVNAMNDNIRNRVKRRDNPFVFKHISNLKNLERFEDRGPCVMMASPGMIQNGVSRELLERWAPDRKNAIIITGYSVEGTLARSIMDEPEEITGLNGQKIPRRLAVESMSFSAHVDYGQNSQFIDEVRPDHVVLVHGEANTMSRLRAMLQARFKNRGEDIKVHTPRNCEPLYLTFRGDRQAKIIGSLARTEPTPGSEVDKLIVSKDFVYTILDPADLHDFTGLNVSTILQRQRIALHVGWEMVRWHIEGMFGRVVEGEDVEGFKTLRVMDAVDVKQTGPHELVLEWVSSLPSDMVADATIALLLGVSSSRAAVKLTTKPHKHGHAHDDGGQSESTAVALPPTSEEQQQIQDETEQQLVAAPHPFSAAAQGNAGQETRRPEIKSEPGIGEAEIGFAQAQHMLTRTETIVALLEGHLGEVTEITIGADATPLAQQVPEAYTSVPAVTVTAAPSTSPETKVKREESDTIDMTDTRSVSVATKAGAGTDGEAASKASESAEEEEHPRLLAARPIDALGGPSRLALLVWLDDTCAAIEVEELVITSASRALRTRVHRCITLAMQALTPLADTFTLDTPLSTNLFAPPPTNAPTDADVAAANAAVGDGDPPDAEDSQLHPIASASTALPIAGPTDSSTELAAADGTQQGQTGEPVSVPVKAEEAPHQTSAGQPEADVDMADVAGGN